MTDTLLSSLLAVQKDAPALQKTKINPAFKSKYVSLDSLMEQIVPVLNSHGLVWTTLPTRDEQGQPALTYRLIHAESGEAIDGTMPLMLAKSDPQGQGSAITYARRYSLMAVLGLVADEDDDGNKASNRKSAAAQNGSSGPTATEADVAEVKTAMKGLTNAKIKLVFGSVGLQVEALEEIPRAKLPALIQQLVAAER